MDVSSRKQNFCFCFEKKDNLFQDNGKVSNIIEATGKQAREGGSQGRSTGMGCMDGLSVLAGSPAGLGHTNTSLPLL